MAKIVVLVLATVVTGLFIVCMIKGRAFASYIEGLSDKEYPLKDAYGMGFYLNTLKPFRLRGALERDLKKQSKLFWDNIYSDYYATLAWAQFLTFSLMAITLVLCLAGLLSGVAIPLVLVLGGMAVAVIWNLTISKTKEAVASRRDECEYEFPTMVSKLALMISTGMITRDAWYKVAYGKEGALYELMQRSCEEMDNGVSEVAAIHKFGNLSDSGEIKKFTSTMIQGLERGGGELAGFLLGQTSEMWNRKRQLALQKGEAAAGKLIIPIGIMFAGVIFIIMSAAMQSFSF